MTVEIDKVGSLEELAEIASVCTACRLCETRKNVVFASGTSDAKVMVVGEGPGQQEDEQGLPFVGRSGQLLISLLAEVGIAREDVYIANVVKCRPPKNRDPRQDEIGHMQAVPSPANRAGRSERRHHVGELFVKASDAHNHGNYPPPWQGV